MFTPVVHNTISYKTVDQKPVQALRQIHEGLHKTWKSRSEGKVTALFLTISGGFAIKSFSSSAVDADFFVAQELTKRKLRILFQRANSSTLKDNIIHLLEEHSSLLPQDLFPYMQSIAQAIRKIASSILQDPRGNENSQVLHLHPLFSSLQNLFLLQSSHYSNKMGIDTQGIHTKEPLSPRQSVETLFRGMSEVREHLVESLPHILIPQVGVNLFSHSGVRDLFPHILSFSLSRGAETSDNSKKTRAIVAEIDPSISLRFPFHEELVAALRDEKPNTPLSETALRLLKNSTSLCISKVESCPFIRDSSDRKKSWIEFFSRCSHITHCKLGVVSDEFIKDTFMMALERMPHVTELDISCSNIDDDMLAVCPLKNLRILRCRRLPVTGIFLKYKAFQRLRVLDITACRSISENTFKTLVLPNLKQLDCRNTSFTHEYVEELRQKGMAVSF